MASEVISRKEALAQGLKRYFTAVPCKRGHISERQVSSLTCMECQRLKAIEVYPTRDREKERQRLSIWRSENREKVNAASRAANATEKTKERKAAWFQANKGRVREKRLANPNSSASCVASAKRWAEENPEKAREYSRMNRRNRRARAKDAGGTHTPADLAEIFAAQGGRCAYCRADLKRGKKHVDHIEPLARGGSNGRENLQYLCQPCNQSKSSRDPIDFANSIGLLL